MMYLILNYILQNLISIFCAITISFALTPKYPRFRSLLVYSAVSLCLFGIKFHGFENPMVLQTTIYLTQIALFLFLSFAFIDSFFLKCIVYSIIFFCDVMTEYIALLILNSLSSYLLALAPDSKEFFLSLILVLPIHLLSNLIFLFFWKFTEYKNNIAAFCLFTLVPMLQLLVTAGIFAPALLNDIWSHTALLNVSALITLFSTVILFYYILRRHEKQSIEAAYLELQEIYRMESEYYQELETRHEELSKIRHDYNNQLSALYILISSNQLDDAKKMADSITRQLTK